MVSLIVAHADQFVIGFKNKMPWHLPADLKHVKSLTTNQTIVMGRKTFESLGKPLPNRKNVVLTRSTDFSHPEVDVIHSIEEISKLDGKVFIFGGANIYKQTMHLVDEMFVTRIEAQFGGDTFFPAYDLSDWEIVDSRDGDIDDKNIYPHKFLHLKRK